MGEISLRNASAFPDVKNVNCFKSYAVPTRLCVHLRKILGTCAKIYKENALANHHFYSRQ